MVYDVADGGCRWVEKLRQCMIHTPAAGRLVEAMIERKRRCFGGDQRLVGRYEFFRRDGQWRLRVEARAPGANPA